MRTAFIIMMLFIFGRPVMYCQCTNPGLKIESLSCTPPQGLSIRSTSCTNMDVSWGGEKNQSYVLKASNTDPLSMISYAAKTSAITCDIKGNCNASISVVEGFVTSWSVEALCIMEGASFFSPEVKGEDVSIPICKNESAILNDSGSAGAIRVYPNPTTGKLAVELPRSQAGNINFQVLDGTGKQVYRKVEAANATNRYTINLGNLPGGIYLLMISDPKKKSTVKFELIRK